MNYRYTFPRPWKTHQRKGVLLAARATAESTRLPRPIAASPRQAIDRSLQVRGEHHTTIAKLELSSLLCLRACTTQDGTRHAPALRLAKHLPRLIASLRSPQVYSPAPGGVDQGSMENERMTVQKYIVNIKQQIIFDFLKVLLRAGACRPREKLARSITSPPQPRP